MLLIHPYLALHGPFHSTKPQGLRRRIKRTLVFFATSSHCKYKEQYFMSHLCAVNVGSEWSTSLYLGQTYNGVRMTPHQPQWSPRLQLTC